MRQQVLDTQSIEEAQAVICRKLCHTLKIKIHTCTTTSSCLSACTHPLDARGGTPCLFSSQRLNWQSDWAVMRRAHDDDDDD